MKIKTQLTVKEEPTDEDEKRVDFVPSVRLVSDRNLEIKTEPTAEEEQTDEGDDFIPSGMILLFNVVNFFHYMNWKAGTQLCELN